MSVELVSQWIELGYTDRDLTRYYGCSRTTIL